MKVEDMFINVQDRRRPRKYTEYFPEMLNVANLDYESKGGDEGKQKDIYTPRERKTFDFPIPSLEGKISEDESEIYGSYAQINIGEPKQRKNQSRMKKLSSIHIENESISGDSKKRSLDR